MIPLWAPFILWEAYNQGLSHYSLCLFLFFLVSTSLGITLGYHRLSAHRSFKCSKPLQALLLFFGSLALQGPVAYWVSIHLKHHRFADEEGDPHSPRDSLLWAHCGWIFKSYAPELHRYGKTTLSCPMNAWFTRHYIWLAVLSLGLPALLGGWEGFLWGGIMRLFYVTQLTWAINSLTHKFGHPAHSTGDQSRNLPLLSFFTFGESWHNNHHASPGSAYFGQTKQQLDPGAWCLMLFEKAGWVWDVKKA